MYCFRNQNFMKGTRAWLIAALVGVISIMSYFFLISNNDKNQQTAQKVSVQYGKVVKITQDVPSRIQLKAEMLKLDEQTPSEYIHPMAVIDLKDAVNMITLVPLNAGEQLLKTKIANPDTNFLSYRLKEGHVPFPVPISELTASGNMIRVGDKVNVLGNFAKNVSGKDSTQYIMYDVPVIAIGNQMAINTSAADSEKSSTMTLEVTPEDAEKLSWAQGHGNLTFVLKSVMDKDSSNKVVSVDSKSLFGDTQDYKDLEYVNMINGVNTIRGAEKGLIEYGQGDLQQIRKQLDYNKFYYDNLNPTSNSTNTAPQKK